MQALWSASLNHLLRKPTQLALALLGLALGVGTITAVDIATASAGKAFELSMDAVNGTVTHQIIGGPGGIDELEYVALRVGKAAALTRSVEMAPVVEGYVAAGDQALQLLGIDPSADAGVRGQQVAGLGVSGKGGAEPHRWFIERGTVLMSRATANQLGIQPDDVFPLDIGGRVHSARLLAALEATGPGYESLVVTDIAQAQEWLGMAGQLSRIDLRLPPGAAGEAAFDQLRAVLPNGLQLREAPRRAQQNVEMTRAFTINLQAMSLLALLVSVFLIYSAISFAVVQRRRIFAVLRALGATRSQVLLLVLAEAAAIGCIGAALGIALGALIGRGLLLLVSRTINDLYFVLSVNEVVLPWSAIAKAALAGMLVVLVAAALPALEAAGSAPQLSLRRSTLERRAQRTARWMSLLGASCAVASGVIVTVSERSLLAGFTALFLLLIAVAAFAPTVLRALALVAARWAGRASPVARLTFHDIAASLSRTGVAIAALGMALAAMIGVAVMVESFRESLRAWLDKTLVADFYISAPGPGFARPERRLEPEIVAALRDVKGVSAFSASRRSSVESPHGPITLDALQLNTKGRAAIELTQGHSADVWRAFENGALVISEPLAWRLKSSVGGELTLTTAFGPRAFRIAGVYREYGNDRGAALMSRAIYRQLWRDDAITALGIYLAPGVSRSEALASLRMAAATVPQEARQALHIRSGAELRTVSMSIFERTFVITRVLYWLAAGVAAIGLVSALLAWELERSRELAMLRSMGLTPKYAAALIESQTGFMGMAAFAAAVPAGLLTAAILTEVINRRAFGWRIDLHLSAAQLGNALLLALGGSLLAGVYPAWRSARLSIADGMREE